MLPSGGSTYVYILSSRGEAYLRRCGIEVRPRQKGTDLDYYRLLHTFALNDFLLLAFTQPLPLKRWFHDYDLKQRLRGSPVPDAWVEFLLPDGGSSRCIALELDRGTMGEKQWKSKIVSYLQWIQGKYQESFGVTSLTVAVVTPTEPRARALCRWTESVLAEQGKLEVATLFRFGAFDLAEATAEAVFLSPNYLLPFGGEHVRLL